MILTKQQREQLTRLAKADKPLTLRQVTDGKRNAMPKLLTFDYAECVGFTDRTKAGTALFVITEKGRQLLEQTS